MEDDIKFSDIENVVNDKQGQCKSPKKKKKFELLLLRLKTFLLKDNKYDLRKLSYNEHTGQVSINIEILGSNLNFFRTNEATNKL